MHLQHLKTCYLVLTYDVNRDVARKAWLTYSRQTAMSDWLKPKKTAEGITV